MKREKHHFSEVAEKKTLDEASQIEKRAYELYELRGCQHGLAMQDWMQAEREIQDASSSR